MLKDIKKLFRIASVSGIIRRKVTVVHLENIKNMYKSSNVLDIGSGIKNWSFLFPDTSKYHTLDLKDDVNATFVGDLFTLDFKDSYNLIIATELIEHLNSSKDFFEKASDLLDDKGILLISFPFFFKIHGDPYDYYRFTLDGIKALSNKQFEVITSDIHGNKIQLIWEILVDNKLMYPFKVFNKLIAKINHKNKYYPLGYIITLRKR